MVTRKHESEANAYPGIVVKSMIEFDDPQRFVVPATGVTHRTEVINYSLISFDVHCESACDKDYLSYEACQTADGNTWSGTFTAHFRWDAGPRTSGDSTKLCARPGSGAARDREVSTAITLRPPLHAAIQPVTLVLQVDTDGQ